MWRGVEGLVTFECFLGYAHNTIFQMVLWNVLTGIANVAKIQACHLIGLQGKEKKNKTAYSVQYSVVTRPIC